MKAIANHTTLGQHNTRLQPHKGVPRDINEAITCILLQSKFDSKPLSLPISLACLFRFCQTSNRLCLDDERGKVFDIGWLVHNNTEPTQLLEQNPPDCRKTPRHMHAFMCSTPRKEQGNAFNISLTSSLNKEKARCQLACYLYLSVASTTVKSFFLLNYAAGKPYKLVHFGAIPITRKKFLPMKNPFSRTINLM